MEIGRTRRDVLHLASAGTTAAIAGCADGYDDQEVTVVERRPAELTDPGDDPIEVRVLVHNLGAPATVEVTVEVVDLDGDVIETVSTQESFDRDEQRSVYLEVTPGPTGDVVFAEATIVED